MKVTIELDEEIFQNLDYTKEEVKIILMSLFKEWYNKNYINEVKVDIEGIDKSIDYIRTDLKNNMSVVSNKLESFDNKISRFENNINKVSEITNDMNVITKDLFALSKSTKKGKVFENSIEEYFNNNLKDYTFINTSFTNHSGDGIITSPYSKKEIIVEMKNYTANIPSAQLNKFKKDMLTTSIKYGLFISINGIQGKKSLDYEVFDCEDNKMYIIYISNILDFNKIIETGLMLLEKFIEFDNDKKDNNENFKENIIEDLKELDLYARNVISLRQNFNIMEKTIRSSLDSFYSNLRTYETNISDKITGILSKVNLMNTSSSIESVDVLKKYSEHSMGFILTKLNDEFFNGLDIKMFDNKGIELINGNKIIGNITIKVKFLELYVNDLDIKIKVTNENYSKISKFIKGTLYSIVC